MTTVTCIIPSTCSKHTLPHLKRCVTSLYRSAKKSVVISIIVISENSIAKNKLNNTHISKLITCAKNVGFGQMNNIAIEKALVHYDSDYILLVNDDMWVKQNFFSRFMEIDSKSKFDLLNPMIYRKNTKYIDSFGVEYFKSGYAKNNTETTLSTQLATAGCLFIKTSFIKKIKDAYGFYFNPIFYFYIEDVEISIRSIMIGATIKKSDSLVAYHFGSLTSKYKSSFVIYHSYKNLLWTIFLTWPLKYILKNLPWIIATQIWFIIYATRSYGLSIYTNIIIDTFKNFRYIFLCRKKILSMYSKQFTFENIFSKFAFRTYHGKTL